MTGSVYPCAAGKSGHAVADHFAEMRNMVSDHFVDINEMVTIGSGAEREVEDWALSRYACYLVIQNADPGKRILTR